MARKLRNLSISILKPSDSSDFSFDSFSDQVIQCPPMSAPPTTLSMPKDLFPLNEACESCDACLALTGSHTCHSTQQQGGIPNNGLGSPYSTRRRLDLYGEGTSSGPVRVGSPIPRNPSNVGAAGRYRRHPTILPTRHRGSACQVPSSHMNALSEDEVCYGPSRSFSLSTDSTPATTPTDEHATGGLDSPIRSMSLGSLSLGSTSMVDLSGGKKSHKFPKSSSRFRFIDRSFF